MWGDATQRLQMETPGAWAKWDKSPILIPFRPRGAKHEVIHMSMGARLAQARRGQNMTQEQLAEKLGVTRQAVSRWESDTAYPETDKIVRMAALFGVSCDYLLGVSNEPSPTGDKPPSPVTHILREAVGKRVLLTFYEENDFIYCDYARILDFDGGWANVEFVREKKRKRQNPLSLNGAEPTQEGRRETRLISLSSVRTITILSQGGEG